MIDAVASIERRDAAGGRGRATRRDEGISRRGGVGRLGRSTATPCAALLATPRNSLVAVAQIRWKVL